MAVSYSVFQYVGDSLKEHLASILDPAIALPTGFEEPIDEGANVSSSNIVFDSPFDMLDGSANRLSVYLYSLRPNTEQRNKEPEIIYVETPGPKAKVQKFNVVMDLFYMITPFGTSRRNEYAILERIVQVLNINAVLKGAMLKGTLAANNNKEVRIQPLSLSLDEINKLWSIFPNKSHKPSLFYQLTPVNIASAKAPDDSVYITEMQLNTGLYKKAGGM